MKTDQIDKFREALDALVNDFNIKVEEKIKTIVELINNMKGRKYEKEK